MTRMIENAAAGMNTSGGEPAPAQLAGMLDVQAVADLLDCSTRHVYRLADSGRMPRPARLGALVRWSHKSILAWIDEGCPSRRRGVGR